MRCPYCHNLEDKVVDSRIADDGDAIRRRRECLSCGRRFTTWERSERVALTVIKRDGSSELFNHEKLVRGITRACEKRDITRERIERLVEEVEEQLRERGEVVTSEEIGLLVLAKLRELDEVAYIRFASVYKDFQDAVEFGREVGDLLKERERGSVLQKKD